MSINLRNESEQCPTSPFHFLQSYLQLYTSKHNQIIHLIYTLLNMPVQNIWKLSLHSMVFKALD